MTDQFSDREWFAVLSKPGQQTTAVKQLEAQQYRAFLPMAMTERRNGPGRVETVIRPLFGRYVFVGVDFDQDFRPLRSTIGVQCVVCGYGGMPVHVPRLALRRVAKRLDAGGVLDLRPALPAPGPMVNWEPGEALEVIDGPFREFSATLLEWADKRRETARIAVNIFGRTTPVEAPVAALRPMRDVRAA